MTKKKKVYKNVATLHGHYYLTTYNTLTQTVQEN